RLNVWRRWLKTWDVAWAPGFWRNRGVLKTDGQTTAQFSTGTTMLAYEELKGFSGRQIRFRPQRYDARLLFPNLAPRVSVRMNAYRLHDISLGGLAALSKHSHDDHLEIGENVELSIQQSGLPIFESTARVCRSESTVFGSKVAFNFVDRFIEFDK